MISVKILSRIMPSSIASREKLMKHDEDIVWKMKHKPEKCFIVKNVYRPVCPLEIQALAFWAFLREMSNDKI